VRTVLGLLAGLPDDGQAMVDALPKSDLKLAGLQIRVQGLQFPDAKVRHRSELPARRDRAMPNHPRGLSPARRASRVTTGAPPP